MAPRNLNNLMGAGAGGNSSALATYSGSKNDSDLVDENIDERILRLLGLEDIFDIDYGTYKTLLKEKLAAARMTNAQIPVEEDELIRDEFKRIRGKEGRFKVKKKKITAQDIKFTRPISSIVKYNKSISALSKSLPSTEEDGGEKKESNISKDVGDNLKSINETLDKILKSFLTQSNADRKRREKDRSASEKRKSQERESGLEKPLQIVKNLAKKIIQPFQGILDTVFRFLTFTFLGWLVGKYNEIQKWVDTNKDKVNTITRFLKDWWPALLTAYVAFFTPFGKLVRSTIALVARFSAQIIKFLAKNPLIAAGALAGFATFEAFKWKQKEEKRLVDGEAKKRGVKPEAVKAELDEAKKSPLGMIGEAFSAIGPMGYWTGGSIPTFGFSGGGPLNLSKYFSGIVSKNTGQSVSGYGKDTQMLPVEGGGTAVLQPGETVLQVGARERMIREQGVDPLAYNVGSNANRPINFTYNSGGIVGMKNGGIVGAIGNFIGQQSKGLGFGGVRAGFTGMGPQGYSAITSGEGYKLPTQKSIFGKGSRPVLGRGAYNAPTVRGASRYMKPGGGIVRTIVPRGAVGNSLVDIFEPQSRVRPQTFDKGRELANRLMSGNYKNSPLANQLRGQLMSGQAVNTMSNISGLGRGSAAIKLMGGVGRLASKFGRIPLLMDMLFPDPTAQYDQLTGPNAYYNAPGYGGSEPLRRQGGGLVSRSIARKQKGGSVDKYSKGSMVFGEVPLIRAALSSGITGQELAAFLAQMSHETGQFKWSRELGRGENMGYSGGSRYHGRGYTQLTHDYNYKNFGNKLGVDLVKDPDLLLKDPNLSARVAIEYWKERVRPKVKNWNDVFAHSAAINHPSATSPGQINGYEDRVSKFNYYSQNLNRIVSRSIPPKPKPQSKPKAKTPSIFENISGFFGGLLGGRGALAKPQKRQLGGKVTTQTGFDIKGGIMGADTQLTPPMALQPGEELYVVPKQAVPYMDQTVAKFDRNSNPAKIQSNLSRSLGPKITYINLPDKVTKMPSSSSDGVGKLPSPNLPNFSVTMLSPKRIEVATALGIQDLV